MEKVKLMLLKMFGKRIVENNIEKYGVSKTKLAAAIYVVFTAIETLSPAWGHPITIPPYVKEFLGGLGLWALRDAVK